MARIEDLNRDEQWGGVGEETWQEKAETAENQMDKKCVVRSSGEWTQDSRQRWTVQNAGRERNSQKDR